jgi:hypothetical protein
MSEAPNYRRSTADDPTRSVYAIRAGEQVKIGMTGNLPSRIRSLQTGTGHPIKVVQVWDEPEAAAVEATMHAALEPYRLMGEWFHCSDELAKMAHWYTTMASLDPATCYVPWADHPRSAEFSQWIDDRDDESRELKMVLHVIDEHFPCLRTLSAHGARMGSLSDAELDGLRVWWADRRDAWAFEVGLPSHYTGSALTWIYGFYLDADQDQPDVQDDRLGYAMAQYERIARHGS